MYRVMKAMREVNFDRVLIADHIPTMVNDHRISTAFTIGYIKALVERVNAEAENA
jgi:mannonate dehydratase